MVTRHQHQQYPVARLQIFASPMKCSSWTQRSSVKERVECRRLREEKLTNLPESLNARDYFEWPGNDQSSKKVADTRISFGRTEKNEVQCLSNLSFTSIHSPFHIEDLTVHRHARAKHLSHMGHADFYKCKLNIRGCVNFTGAWVQSTIEHFLVFSCQDGATLSDESALVLV